MADIAELGFVVRDEPLSRAEDKLDRLVPAADKAAKATDRFNKTAAESPSATGRMASGLGNLTVLAARFATGIAAAFSINMLGNYADAWSDMQSRVGAAIKDMEAAPELMQRLVDVANASYSPLAQTVEIYGRNVAVLKDLGRNANEAADFTESLNHMLVITATRGERAESVQNALSKAMAVGKLQAEGLETVLANGGRVAEALAAELGTTVSGLRQFASEGKITGDVIARAIIKPLEDVRVEAGNMAATITDAFVILNNNVTAAIGTLDKATGTSSAIAGVIIMLAENLNVVGAAAGGVAAVVLTALAPALIAGTGAMWAFTASLLANPLTAVAVVVGLLVTRLILLVQEVGGVGQAFQNMQIIALDVWTRISSAAVAFEATMSQVSDNVVSYFAGKWADLIAMVVGGVSNINKTLGTSFDLTGLVNTHADAIKRVGTYAESAAANGERAAAAWDRAQNGMQMDPIGMGSSWKEFNAVLGQTADTTAGVASNMGAVAGASGAANDNTKKLTESTGYLADAQKSLNEQYEFGKSTLNSFFSDFKSGITAGESMWQSFGAAAVNVLDNIANKALEMASNSIWDMIFGAIGGNFIGGTPGAAPLQLGFQKGIPGWSSGGYTGGGNPSAVAGLVHQKEFVMSADATNRIGVGTLQALNDNMPVSTGGGGNVISVDFRPTYQIDGVGLSMEELQEVLRRNNEQMMDQLPERINAIQTDPRKRVVGYDN